MYKSRPAVLPGLLKTAALIWVLWIGTIPVFSQIRTFDLHTSISIALTNNYDLRQSLKDLLAAGAQMAEASADLYMPSLSLFGSYSKLDPDSVNRSQEYTPAYSALYPDNYSAGLNASRILFSGLQFQNNNLIKRWNYELALAKYQDTKSGNHTKCLNILLL